MDPEFAATVPHLHHRARNQVSVQIESKNAVKPVGVNDRAARRVGRTVLALAVLAAVFYFGFILMMTVSS